MMRSSLNKLEERISGNWCFIRDLKPVDVIPDFLFVFNIGARNVFDAVF
jgi:hypothetical protein